MTPPGSLAEGQPLSGCPICYVPADSGNFDTADMRRGFLFLFLTTAGWNQGVAQTETQHAFDGSFRLSRRLDLVLHSRIRTQPGALGFYQVRGGPILEYAATGAFKIIGGYYYARQEDSDEDFIGGHRWFGGGEAGLWTGRRAKMDLRALAERFQLEQGNDYGRYRFRVRISGRTNWAPYGSGENFLDARGWRSTRYATGLRAGNGSPVSFDLGYFVEPRRTDAGRTRHMFMTGIHWNFGTRRRADPDL